MRTIDADALKARLRGCMILMPNGEKCTAERAIDTQGTIAAEPVQHGRWVETEPDEDDRKIGIEFSIKCSRCHDENSHLDFNENHEITGKTFWKSRYCPNCGALMDGGVKNARTD